MRWKKKQNMLKNLGYTKNLFILPFDHRSTFEKEKFEKKQIIEGKLIIYEAFKKSIKSGISKEESAILVDEEYGDEILQDARENGITTILTTEKSGQIEFDFEYGNDFGEHIKKYNPTFAKALIRFKPNTDWTKLKMLCDYCHNHGYKFLLEVLSGESTPGAQNLTNVISDLRGSDIEPDVWKLEGMGDKTDYESIVAKIKEDGRDNVGLVILGRGENREKVEQWLNAGKNVDGVIGFAVGRTIFWQPLLDFKNGKIGREKAVEEICDNFLHFYKIFITNSY